MKKSTYFFLWIVSLALSLMLIIVFTQVITLKSLGKFQKDNKQATLTFTVNNRLEELVNLAFELEKKFISETGKQLSAEGRGIKDSVTLLGYNSSVLSSNWPDSNSTQLKSLKKLDSLIDQQVELCLGKLNAAKNNNAVQEKKITDSLRNSRIGDSIYTRAILFQQSLETFLTKTLRQNNEATDILASKNRLLAIIAVTAIVVLATIIIRRHQRQLVLIKELEEARKQAYNSAAAKEQFLANMSHEIRTPLNAVRGFSKLMYDTPLDEEQKRYTAIIYTASENLLSIVNDILDFSKIETGTISIRKTAFNLHKEIKEVQLMFETLAREKGLLLQVSIDEKLNGWLYGDPDRLQQVLVNLIGNAIKFTQQGSISLSAVLKKETAQIATVELAVADTGEGIPEDKLGAIFERFEQLDNSFSRQHGGTGLGLSISRKLTELMGGKISVSSQLGKGSVFSFVIDFEKPDESAAESQIRPADKTALTVSPAGKMILIAEDNKMNQLLLQSILSKMNLHSTIVSNGQEAVDLVSKQPFHLVLMDIQMPHMDGISATKKIRENSSAAAVPIVAMTAHVLQGEKEKCMAAGMTDYLTKPIDENELIAVLNKLLHNTPVVKTGQPVTQISNLTGFRYLGEICNHDEKRMKLILVTMLEHLPAEKDALEKSIRMNELSTAGKQCHHLISTLSPLDPDHFAVISLKNFSTLLHQSSDMEKIRSSCSMLVKDLELTTEELKSITAS